MAVTQAQYNQIAAANRAAGVSTPTIGVMNGVGTPAGYTPPAYLQAQGAVSTPGVYIPPSNQTMPGAVNTGSVGNPGTTTINGVLQTTPYLTSAQQANPAVPLTPAQISSANAANPVGAAAVAATATPTPVTYKIASGDNLSTIAKQYGTTVADIMAANPTIKNANLIYAGATLNLPSNSKSNLLGGSNNDGTNIGPVVTSTSETDAATAAATAAAKAAADKAAADAASITSLTNDNTIAGLKASLGLPTEKPQLKDKNGNPVTEATLLTELQAENGVTGLNTQLNTINSQITDAQNAQKQGTFDEQGKLKSMAAMSASERRMNEQATLTMNSLIAQKQAIVDQLNTANNTVTAMMNASNQDYTNSVNSYNTQYSDAINLQQLLDTKTNQEASQANVVSDNARANATILTNSYVTSGKMPDATGELALNTLDLQMRLPSGTTLSAIQAGIGAYKTSVITTNADGTKTVSYYTASGNLVKQNVAGTPNTDPTTGKPVVKQTAAEIKQSSQDAIQADVKRITGTDGYVNTATIQKIRQQIALTDPTNLTYFDNAYPPSKVLNPKDTTAAILRSNNKW